MYSQQPVLSYLPNPPQPYQMPMIGPPYGPPIHPYSQGAHMPFPENRGKMRAKRRIWQPSQGTNRGNSPDFNPNGPTSNAPIDTGFW
ncbi:hypothetical protein TWF730_010580 [Orbilia blumenaviensis]|uniref:Uncharacterized protein n=1 Tax=Orbilia blumenaviensis TaxID=1796055 RepID=A0AAV9UPG6_9PEZI